MTATFCYIVETEGQRLEGLKPVVPLNPIEDKSIMFLLNVGTHLPDYIMS
jgi:hypothetical protein